MKFDHFQALMQKTFSNLGADGAPQPWFSDIPAERLHPLVLAYIGDAYFNLYVRTSLLAYEQNKVRVLHSYGARMVSATLQSYALKELEPTLSEDELAILRRGRNAKSTVPRSASVADYRNSTGFEALVGYLYLTRQQSRLEELVQQTFTIISRKLSKDGNGEEK